ncbi:hypothetical protein SKAU_G00119920, partial [Synaphobranchus kaupii]
AEAVRGTKVTRTKSPRPKRTVELRSAFTRRGLLPAGIITRGVFHACAIEQTMTVLPAQEEPVRKDLSFQSLSCSRVTGAVCENLYFSESRSPGSRRS